MKRLLGCLTLLGSSFLAAHTAAAEGRSVQYLVLACSRDNDLVSYEIESATGALKEHARLKLTGTGGPMSLTPDGHHLYVESHIMLEGEKRPVPHVVSLAVKNGRFDLLHTARVRLRSPSIHVDATGRNLLAAHYGEGKVSVWKIDEKHRCTGELLDDHTTAPRAHFITTDPGNRFAYVPHTSPNAVYQFSLDTGKGKLTPLAPPFVEGPEEDHRYHAPRHYAHHPKLPFGYTANESGGGISTWAFDAKTGRLTLKQTLCTLPPGWEGNSAGADIHVTPDGRFVYMSNRDNRRIDKGAPRKDTLAGYRIGEDGMLTLIGHFPTVYFPRSFCIDRTGRYVYAAGQLSSKLAAYRIDGKTGKLERIGTYDTGETPIWVLTTK